MRSFQKDFEDFKSTVWLNAASEGPLPIRAKEALNQYIHFKAQPQYLDIPKFISVPLELKKSIGRLLHLDYKDVILANSASYGIHLLANGIDWQTNDEILLMQNDFPTNIIPWLALEDKGVLVKQIKPKNLVLTLEDCLEHVNDRTRLICLSHVHTFTGLCLDIEKFSQFCRKRNIILVVNVSQSVGSIPVDVTKMDVDVIVCAGYKWLCGPCGTGFCWIKPELRKTLNYNQAYWPVYLSEQQLQSEDSIKRNKTESARNFDMLGVSNFFNFVPLTACIDYFCNISMETVWKYNSFLLNRFIELLDGDRYNVISLDENEQKSGLLFFSHKDETKNAMIHKKLIENGIYTGFWKNNIRVAPHIYNTQEQIDKIISVLNG